MMNVRLEASKKASYKPYLAKLTSDGREFAKKHKITNSRKGFTLEVEVGDVIDGRGSVWCGDDFRGGYFCGLVTAQGVITIDRAVADFVLQQKAEGWTATGLFAVDDGQHAVRIGNDEPVGDTPLPGEGDCSGLILERDGEIKLVEDYQIHADAGQEDYEGRKTYIAPAPGGFAKCDMAPRLHQLEVY